ncbi:hypothetical protein SYN63AY4M2_10185 [Synechococcus sp. 63AY4M2]|nr:hypothetical protein SYN63AY4M2_10185 [Synechococcus sp. 63AY4M2]PIK89625.1 hypothetical protein SYN65AY6A5_00435 [Synechococcus sp. 65AY6A5]PIK93193.1 hypothetical protein SYN65AY6LI_07665 [Synechococcus sp. 65AY6Li]PIK96504.1 hypothetical protein SYN60AY4M2_10795 [Synechococcus sp. 60AY4M2]PIK99102.1 hypothetical protein SYN63AY4M1_08190 [Synechococcus sp. 63AY4M1]
MAKIPAATRAYFPSLIGVLPARPQGQEGRQDRPE